MRIRRDQRAVSDAGAAGVATLPGSSSTTSIVVAVTSTTFLRYQSPPGMSGISLRSLPVGRPRAHAVGGMRKARG